ncbi:MAG: NucA/NucB deoxyribonuclease domain-containing protein, partial [Bacteroidota bacterium]
KGNSVAQLYVGWMKAGTESLPDFSTDTRESAQNDAQGVSQALEGDISGAMTTLNVNNRGDAAALSELGSKVRQGDMQAIGATGFVATATAASFIGPKVKPKAKIKTISIDGAKYPESAAHLADAIKSGKSNVGVVDRAGASSRRRNNLKGVKTQKGKDRDEAPPAVINTGEAASVRLINSSDNRGAGSSIGNQLRGVQDGTKVRIVPKNNNRKNK